MVTVREQTLRTVRDGRLRYDLLPPDYALGAIHTTRGCPLSCSFCSVTAFNGARYRQRSIVDVVKEFQSIREKRVFVVDDNLIGTTPPQIDRAKELFQALAEANLHKQCVAQIYRFRRTKRATMSKLTLRERPTSHGTDDPPRTNAHNLEANLGHS